MNDIVFAGDVATLRTNPMSNYGRCLKVFLPKGKEDVFAFFGLSLPEGEGVVICIDQPLLPAFEKNFYFCAREQIEFAARQAELCPKGGAVYGALGALIVGYIADCRAKDEQPAVKLLKSDIESSFTDHSFSVDMAISKLPLNYDYVRKLFKKEVGVTPHEYLIRLRLHRAKDIILCGITNRYSEFSVSQIAEACGFAEPLYFSRVFKKYYGVSPSSYIKQNVK